MLGSGRPFVLELLEPRAPEQPAAAYEALAATINRNSDGRVEVSELRACTLATIQLLDQSKTEDAHRKDYRCVVKTSRDLTSEDMRMLNEKGDLLVQQMTPLRVLHRRTLMTRPRYVYAMRAALLTPRFFTLDVTTQAGTYVKEFVHGDLGRTEPSVGSLLGCDADILQLDVLGLHET